MHDKHRLECNLIVDDDFMNKDVSELITEDYYLFHTNGNKIWLYKDWHIGVAYLDICDEESFYSAEYSKGTLQEYVDSL